jgi:hypothetical protein
MDESIIRAGRPLPRIASAAVGEGRAAEITWTSGLSEVVDLMPALASGRSYVKLRTDDALFRTLRVSEFGDSVVWDNGAELSAVWIEELACEGLRNSEFRQAMDDLNMSLDGMAVRLGIARRLVAEYRKDKPIPKTVALAVKYLVEQQRRAG